MSGGSFVLSWRGVRRRCSVGGDDSLGSGIGGMEVLGFGLDNVWYIRVILVSATVRIFCKL